MNTSAAVTAYRRHAAGTATNSQLVLMLTARLTSDIAQAMSAINDRQPASAHEFLTHAQDIVNELDDALDTDLCSAVRLYPRSTRRCEHRERCRRRRKCAPHRLTGR